MNARAVVSSFSISTRLTLWFGTSLLVLLGLFVAGLYISVHLGLHDDLEARLREEATAIQAHHKAHGPDGAGEASPIASHELQSTPGTFVRLLGPEGKVVQASPSLQVRPPLSPELPPSRASTVKTRTWGGLLHSRYTCPSITRPPLGWRSQN